MKKSPGISVLLSIVLPGAGSIYSERIGKGIAYLIFTFIGYCCFVIPGLALHVCSIFSAYNDSLEFNKDEQNGR
jgi:TM2 domain-containing membrane protein YozV